MNYNKEQIQIIYDKYYDFINNLNYDDNLKLLLRIIIPSFIIYYGIEKEKIIIDTIKSTNIKYDKNNKIISKDILGFYYTKLYKANNLLPIVDKRIILKYFNIKDPIKTIEVLVHELNHSINSYNKTITLKNNKYYLRTGLSYIIYDKELKPLTKEKDYILEEIINTKQTESIMNIINSLININLNNDSLKNIVSILDYSFKLNYKSIAYVNEVFFSKEITSNKVFFNTLCNLRLKGYIEDIEYWFDNIIGEKGIYKEFLNNLVELNKTKPVKSIFKFKERRFENRIRYLYRREQEIMKLFNRNCNFG